jgi:hypothetical protein
MFLAILDHASHHAALKKILEGIEKQIAVNEVRLLRAASDEQSSKLVEEIADLTIRQKEVKDALLADRD